jgi:hypothetical protein
VKFRIYRDEKRLNGVLDVLVADRAGMHFRMADQLGSFRPLELGASAANAIVEATGDCYAKAVEKETRLENR